MNNFLRVFLFATVISAIIIPSQKFEYPSLSEYQLENGQNQLLAQKTTSDKCGDSPSAGCGRRDSSARTS